MELFLNFLKAFVAGGFVCVIGQLLIDLTKMTPARILVLFVISGVVLSALGIYGPFSDWAGSGASVPLTGFGHVLVEGTRKEIDNLGWLGIFTGPLSSASVGISAAIISGFLVSIVAKPKSK